MEEPQRVKPHRSKSQIEMYLRCPEQFRRRYIAGEKRPPSIHAHRGSGFHGGVERNYKQKILSREDLPVSDIVESAVAAFEERLESDGVSFSQEDESRGIKNVIGEAKDMTARMSQFWGKEVAPLYQPAMVEEKVTIALPGATHDLMGIIDIATEDGEIRDMKTAAKAKPKDAADTSLQLTIYAVAYTAKTGKLPTKVALDTIVDSKSGVKYQPLESTRTVDDLKVLANKLNVVEKAIETDVFPPAPEGSWWCSERWCGYWHDCPYVNQKERTIIDLGGDS